MSHANAVDSVQVREWNHSDAIVVLDEWDSITELAAVDHCASSTDAGDDLVAIKPTAEKSLHVDHVKAFSAVLEIFLLLRLLIVFNVCEDVWLRRFITGRVQVVFVDANASTDVQAFEKFDQLETFVVNLNDSMSD